MSASDVKDFGLDPDCRFDRVGDKTIVFGFFQKSRHAREIVGRSNDNFWVYGYLGDLIATPGGLL